MSCRPPPPRTFRSKEQTKREKGTLQHDVEALELEVCAEKQMHTAAENNLGTITHWLELQLSGKDTAVSEAHLKAEQLEKDLEFEKAQAQKLQEKLSKKEEDLFKHMAEAKETVERFQAETSNIASPVWLNWTNRDMRMVSSS